MLRSREGFSKLPVKSPYIHGQVPALHFPSVTVSFFLYVGHNEKGKRIRERQTGWSSARLPRDPPPSCCPRKCPPRSQGAGRAGRVIAPSPQGAKPLFLSFRVTNPFLASRGRESSPGKVLRRCHDFELNCPLTSVPRPVSSLFGTARQLGVRREGRGVGRGVGRGEGRPAGAALAGRVHRRQSAWRLGPPAGGGGGQGAVHDEPTTGKCGLGGSRRVLRRRVCSRRAGICGLFGIKRTQGGHRWGVA